MILLYVIILFQMTFHYFSLLLELPISSLLCANSFYHSGTPCILFTCPFPQDALSLPKFLLPTFSSDRRNCLIVKMPIIPTHFSPPQPPITELSKSVKMPSLICRTLAEFSDYNKKWQM